MDLNSRRVVITFFGAIFFILLGVFFYYWGVSMDCGGMEPSPACYLLPFFQIFMILVWVLGAILVIVGIIRWVKLRKE